MMSIEHIESLADEQAAKASRAGICPRVVPKIWDTWDRLHRIDFIRRIPNIGSHRPDGWSLGEELFVDSSGFGSSGEPAMTLDQFLERAKVGYGYAIIREGQFQIYIGEFTLPNSSATLSEFQYDDEDCDPGEDD